MKNQQSKCSICGWEGVFSKQRKSIREDYACGKCKASLRYREQATCILEKYAEDNSTQTFEELTGTTSFQDLSIYEPGLVGPFRNYFKNFKYYQNSYFWQNVKPGNTHKGIQCQSLEDLTFADSVFDLIITSDILEHVRHPRKAFEEIYRVLKPGGNHIFTVPILWPPGNPTRVRVDTSTDKDVHILEPRYHGSPVDPDGSLVYNDFGLDILGLLEKVGFSNEFHGIEYNVTFCSSKPFVD